MSGQTKGSLAVWALAREVAHRNCRQCTGGTGYGPGGDGPRWHSKRCDALTEDIVNLITALPEGRAALRNTQEKTAMPPVIQLTDEELETVLSVLKSSRDDVDAEHPADLDELIDKVEAAQIRSRTGTTETPETPPGAA